MQKNHIKPVTLNRPYAYLLSGLTGATAFISAQELYKDNYGAAMLSGAVALIAGGGSYFSHKIANREERDYYVSITQREIESSICREIAMSEVSDSAEYEEISLNK